MKTIMIIIATVFIIGCGKSSYDEKACDGHGGVALCWRMHDSTHGKLMCNDGTKSTKDCY